MIVMTGGFRHLQPERQDIDPNYPNKWFHVRLWPRTGTTNDGYQLDILRHIGACCPISIGSGSLEHVVSECRAHPADSGYEPVIIEGRVR